MSNVSIIDFCSDVRKHSVGLSPIAVAINKAKCAKMRVARLKGGNVETDIPKRKASSRAGDDDVIITNDTPPCIKNFSCIDVSNFDYEKWGKNAEKLGIGIVSGVSAMIGEIGQGLFTWEGSNELLMSLIIEELGEKLVMRIGGAIYKKGVIKAVSAACSKGAASFTSLSMSIAAKFSTRIATQVALKAAATGAAEGATTKVAASVACPPCAAALVVLLVFQLASMAFDAWDPFGCNDGAMTVSIMNAEYLRNMSESVNTVFRDAFLSSIMPSIEMPNGDVVAIENKWPVEYDILGLGGTDEIPPHKNTIIKLGFPTRDECGQDLDYSWMALELLLMAQYTSSLTRNSYGQPVYIAHNSENDRIFTLDDLDVSSLRGMYALMISNKNTSLAKWIYAWWPLLLLLFFILIFVLIKLII